MNPKDYRPSYDSGCYEYLVDGDGQPIETSIVNINERYCLLFPSGMLLKTLFSGTAVGVPAMFLAPPISQAAGSPFHFNHDVPWFKFTVNGQPALRNAGQIATYWGMPGVPYDQALNYAVIDVQTEVEGQ